MKFGYYSYTTHIQHEVGDTHPEHPMRIIAINRQMDLSGLLADCYHGGSSEIDQADLLRAHTPGYLEQLSLMSPKNGSILANVDTPMSTGSLDAAYQAASCAINALDDIMTGRIDRAFCAVRPPGHHAERNKTMGFCFLNNVAIAAKKAQLHYGLKRIAVIDFDAHQCNGTINILADDPDFLICSSFQHPSFPFTHWRNKHQNVLNIALPERTIGIEMRRLVEEQWLKQLQDFKPQLTIISAGFDAHIKDPTADLEWDSKDYAWLGAFLSDINKETPDNKILAVLEGGYHLGALAQSSIEFISHFID